MNPKSKSAIHRAAVSPYRLLKLVIPLSSNFYIPLKFIRIHILLLAWFSIVNVDAQIGIGSIANNTSYTTSARFVVTNEAGYTYDAQLDGAGVPVGVSVPVTSVDYHELLVLRTNTSTLAVTRRLMKFIVRSAERGGTEDGLPPWTPYPAIPSAGGEFTGGTLRVLAPKTYPQGMQIPIVAWVEDAKGHAMRVNGSVTAPGQNSIPLTRGVGSGFLSASNSVGPLSYQPGIGGLATNKSITVEFGTVWTGVSGTLSGAIHWPANSRIAITNHVVLADGATLTIGAGTIVRVSPGVDITNNAAVVINGTWEQPVVFTPVSPSQPWGGFTMRTSAGSITGTGAIFTGSGANATWFGAGGNPGSHRTEQGLFFCAGNNVIHLTDSAAVWLAGQLGHAVAGGTFTFNHFLMQRATSGGEFTGSSWRVNDSAFIECPDDTANFVDGDNDALYFVSGTHGFTNTLIGFTKDDGIDSGGSGSGVLNYQDCWFESTFHEGNSLSGSGKIVNHLRTVFINCGQGLEVGYEGPTGNLIGCLATANLVGGRFGDNYSSSYTGTLRATNSLLIYNYRDVWGLCWDDWTYRTNSMDLRSNFLSVADPRWPTNTVWNPATDASRLAEFITGNAESAVGIGIALRTNRLTAVEFTNGIPVRLSRFSTNVVMVNYSVEGTGGMATSGTLTFQPGETLKILTLPIAMPQNYELLSVRLANPVNGEITGIAQTFTVTPPATGSITPLIPFNSTWRYLDTGVDQGTAWIAGGFDESGWSTGTARLGYKTGTTSSGFATVLKFGPDTANKYRTYYFRKSFTVASVDAFASLFLETYRDDGVAVYLNGQNFYRNNLPSGTLAFSLFATNCTDDGAIVQSATLSLAALVNGVNVIAVEVHQSSASSSDLVFDLQLAANPAAAVLLKQTLLGNGLALYWEDPTFNLEESSALPGGWTPVTPSGSVHLFQPAGGSRFYRLKR